MIATPPSLSSETAGDGPDFAQSAEPDSQPLLIVPNGPGMDVVRAACVLRMSQLVREPQWHPVLQGERCLPQASQYSLPQERCLSPQERYSLPQEQCIWPQ